MKKIAILSLLALSIASPAMAQGYPTYDTNNGLEQLNKTLQYEELQQQNEFRQQQFQMQQQQLNQQLRDVERSAYPHHY